MAVESAADRLAFLVADDFGVDAVIAYRKVTGIFDNEYFGVDIGGQEVESNQPTFLCRSADLPTVTLGTTTVTIGSAIHVVISNQPDGTGMTLLRLREYISADTVGAFSSGFSTGFA